MRRSPIPASAALVVRGDQLDPVVLRADATRFRRRFREWDRYGVSAFVATGDDEIDALCETRMRAWAVVVVFDRKALEVSGVQIVPTFRVPHVTLAHTNLDDLLNRLVSCDHRVVVNPYHEPEIGPWRDDE